MKFRAEFRLVTDHLYQNEPQLGEIYLTVTNTLDRMIRDLIDRAVIKDSNNNDIGVMEIVREDDE